MKKTTMLMLVSIFIAACDSKTQKNVIVEDYDLTKLNETYGITSQHVCQFGLAKDLGLQYDELKFEGVNVDKIYKSQSGYKYACYLEGNQIVWRAYPEGRWRNSYSQGDTRITWYNIDKGLAIKRVHLDGSSSTENYNFN